ncbi:UDP-N-acetylmuramoyl-tripeptide--D-alanyl-D-alanine ligase [Teredinibacter haidensis]|uniref:UDP-N-acetylmuramoyl-tripeptide--D-alanyl-D- alanine ligase n=1 Tax=Teredinibacter haidensis TaxID=2731755 RepID=UPI0009491313|nr:UDP-N-acetylmuramoyl-tripeptide--D-alanyl-D-alanine ligase [Teredinibacter haidensis]
MMLSDLCSAVDGKVIGADTAFARVSTDTRSIKKGDLFFALKGANFDAHHYLVQAVQAGACAIVVEKESPHVAVPQLLVEDCCNALGQAGRLNREAYCGMLVAITGSNGKTTVKGMLKSVFSERGRVLATEGNLNNHIGVPLTLMKLDVHHSYAVLEAGTSGKNEIAYLTSLIQPEIALVNNIMSAHLEGFGCKAAIAEEKSAIYSSTKLRIGVVNLNSAYCSEFLLKLKGKTVTGFARVETTEELERVVAKFDKAVNRLVLARVLVKDDRGCNRFELIDGTEQSSVTLRVPGLHNVNNALAAAACALSCGLPLSVIVVGLEKFAGESGRMQTVASILCDQLVDDSYNANPGSMRAAIDFLAEKAKSVLIVGDMAEVGSNAEQEHFAIGDYAKKKGINTVIAVGPLSRFVAEGYGEGAVWFSGREELFEGLGKLNFKNSVVLVKGSRNSRMEKVVQTLKQREEDC